VSYINYGARRVVGAADNTGNNSGNWTVEFTPAILAINQIPFECYKIIVSGAPGSTFEIFIDQNQWDNVQVGQLNSWDPNQVMLINPGQTVYFYWSDAVTDDTPPTVTMWLRGEQS
jgi:hypothetical protein